MQEARQKWYIEVGHQQHGYRAERSRMHYTSGGGGGARETGTIRRRMRKNITISHPVPLPPPPSPTKSVEPSLTLTVSNHTNVSGTKCLKLVKDSKCCGNRAKTFPDPCPPLPPPLIPPRYTTKSANAPVLLYFSIFCGPYSRSSGRFA